MNWTKKKYLIIGIVIILLINEYTLAYFDTSPPLSKSTINKIRFFDFLVAVFSITSSLLLRYSVFLITKISLLIKQFVLPTLILILLLDVVLGIIGFGYPSHYDEENIERYPSPADTFRGKPNVKDHNEYGFRGNFNNSSLEYSVAIFGGSTTYSGSPPIIEIISKRLSDLKININTYNFGSISSNHSQHVHRLLEFTDKFKFDLVIFYGGANETLQYLNYDPRPGYPYNFYFRNELNPLIQSLLRYSSILGSIDIYSGGIFSGLRKLRDDTFEDKWQSRIISNYWRDIEKANTITSTIVQPNICKRPIFVSIIQPSNPKTEMQIKLWNQLIESQKNSLISWEHLDLSSMTNEVEFLDIMHVNQSSREKIAFQISKLIKKIYSNNCN